MVPPPFGVVGVKGDDVFDYGWVHPILETMPPENCKAGARIAQHASSPNWFIPYGTTQSAARVWPAQREEDMSGAPIIVQHKMGFGS